jgi:hypothetical protein
LVTPLQLRDKSTDLVFHVMTTTTAVSGVLLIIGFIMAIVGNYNMWWGADSMIGVWGAVGILGLFLVIAASIKLNTSRHR